MGSIKLKTPMSVILQQYVGKFLTYKDGHRPPGLDNDYYYVVKVDKEDMYNETEFMLDHYENHKHCCNTQYSIQEVVLDMVEISTPNIF